MPLLEKSVNSDCYDQVEFLVLWHAAGHRSSKAERKWVRGDWPQLLPFWDRALSRGPSPNKLAAPRAKPRAGGRHPAWRRASGCVRWGGGQTSCPALEPFPAGAGRRGLWTEFRTDRQPASCPGQKGCIDYPPSTASYRKRIAGARGRWAKQEGVIDAELNF